MSVLPAILDRVAARPRIAAMALGALAATGFQPLGLWPLGLLAMGGFYLLFRAAANWQEAARLGWFFGFAHFTLANSWIAKAFTYQADMPAALGWVAVPLISLYLAFFPALAAGVAVRLFGQRKGWALVLGFAGVWILSEWLRGWLLTGFPWDPFGIVLLGGFEQPGLARLAPWLGTYALSGLAVLIACSVMLLLERRQVVPLGFMLGAVVAVMIMPAGPGREGTMPFTLVQPDIRQEVLNRPSYYDTNFRQAAALSLPRDPNQKRIVFWPESGTMEYLEDGYPQYVYASANVLGDAALTRLRIARTIGPQSILLTGSADLEIANRRVYAARNSVTALDGKGAIVGSYDKAHLVPFGEYLPLRWLLEPLGATRMVPGTLDFLPGPGPRTLDLGEWGRPGVQVCYEIIFSGHVVDQADRPDYIFNPSNDGWYGSFGPPQHLAQARLRAIEEGLPVLRSTTTGISAVVDARGVVRQHAAMQVAQRIDGLIPPAHAPTLFARLGNWLALGWAVLLLVAALVTLRRGSRA